MPAAAGTGTAACILLRAAQQTVSGDKPHGIKRRGRNVSAIPPPRQTCVRQARKARDLFHKLERLSLLAAKHYYIDSVSKTRYRGDILAAGWQ